MRVFWWDGGRVARVVAYWTLSAFESHFCRGFGIAAQMTSARIHTLTDIVVVNCNSANTDSEA